MLRQRPAGGAARAAKPGICHPGSGAEASGEVAAQGEALALWGCRCGAVEGCEVLVQVLFCWHASVATEQKELTFSRLSDIAMALLHLHLPCPQLMGGCHPLPPPLLQELVRAATINCAKLFQMEGLLGQVRCVGLLPEASLVATAPLLPRGARCW